VDNWLSIKQEAPDILTFINFDLIRQIAIFQDHIRIYYDPDHMLRLDGVAMETFKQRLRERGLDA
jgi:hypothetical protein